MLNILLLAMQLLPIQGKIIDYTSKQPIANAHILIIETQQQVITDSIGNFVFDFNSNNALILKISHVGYKTEFVRTSQKEGYLEIALQPIDLEEITITAIRSDKFSPASQKTLSEAEITATYFGQDTPMLLTQTPAIQAYADGGNYTGYTYMRLRGIDQTRINFTLNGVPLNEPEDQGIYFSNFTDFANSMQSVQIQRGVGTSTYGTASLAGSIGFESISLKHAKPSAALQLGYGSFQTHRLSAEFHTGEMANHFAFYGRYTHAASDGYRDHSGNNSSSFFLSGVYLGKKHQVKITAFSGKATNEMAYLATAISDINQDPRTNYLTEEENDAFGQDFVQLQQTSYLGAFTTFQNSIYYIGIKGNYDVLAGDMLNFDLKSAMYGATSNLQYERAHLKITTGIQANTFQRSHAMGIKPFISQPVYYNIGFKQEASIFAKGSYQIGKFIPFIDLQMRTAYFAYQPDRDYNLTLAPISWNFFNPKVGITYELKENLNLYTSIGKMHREPTRNDIFAGYDDINPENIAEVQDLKRVKPEEVLDIEIGINLTSKNYKLQANLYSMEFKNEIAAIGQLSFIGLPLRKNVAASFRRGVEVDFSSLINKHISFSTNASWSYNRIRAYTTDFDNVTYTYVNPLLTPNWLVNATLQLKPFTKDWFSLAATGRYVSDSYLDNTNNNSFKTPSYFLLGANLTFKFLQNHTLSFQANNILNKRYFTSGYVQNNEAYYFVQAPRNYFATLHLKF